ncbi:MAG: ATP synthase F1 subunit delta [Sphingobacteriales bacterium]|jgi:F-type H+-transporting ATPase subunit delta|nr:ATP synthase F1 subunit delta [Sphingobacteriales bacterium]
MLESKVARRYAKSLLGLAQERNLTDRVFNDMELVSASCAASRELSLLLRNPIVQGDKKEAVVKALFGKQMDAVSMAFLDIIIRKGREGHLEGIAAEYVKLYKAMKGIVTAHVATAVKLDEATRNTILSMVRASRGDKAELVEEVDPSLIGGFVLRVGDQQYDTSVSRKLRQLRNEFDDNLYVKEY